jgi:hypothetical protein
VNEMSNECAERLKAKKNIDALGMSKSKSLSFFRFTYNLYDP